MESNITEQEYFAGESLTEPHFDEEATIAAARPVVPLEEIKAAPYHRRLTFGLAILGALIVGALGGTFIYKPRHSKPAAAIVESAVTGSGAMAQEIPQEPIAETPTQDVPTSGAATATAGEPQQPIVSKSKPKPARVSAPPELVSEEDRYEARRLERIEARRARRAERQAEREAWGKRRAGDDLLRIRDIFEGPRKP